MKGKVKHPLFILKEKRQDFSYLCFWITFERMKKIGITGGIGAGKSMVCQQIEEKGYPVFYTDIKAKELISNNVQIRAEIVALFGDKAYTKKTFNSEFISQQIFSDPNKRQQLNQIVHPEVYKSFDSWCKKQKPNLVFIESALMIETGYYRQLDAVILVVADESVRIKRVMERDHLEREAVTKRIQAQSSDEQKVKIANYLINNDSNLVHLKEQIDAILQEIIG